MSEELTQAEADALLALHKKYTKGQPVFWPGAGAKTSVEIVWPDPIGWSGFNLSS